MFNHTQKTLNLLLPKILYIEDNIGDRILLEDALSSFLNTSGFQCCTTFKEGLELIQENEFDLILLDLSLPDSTGVEIVKQLNDTIRASVPIVVFTGMNNNEAIMSALKFGAQDFLVKGDFNNQVLEKTVRYAIERHKVQHELILKNSEIIISKNMLTRAESMADIGSWEVDFESNQVKLSDGMQRLLGIDSASISIQEFLNFVHPEARSAFQSDVIERSDNFRLPIAVNLKFVRLNNQVFHSSCKIEFTLIASDNYIVHGVTLDITNQREVEQVKEAFTLELTNRVKERTLQLENTKRKLEKSLSKEKELGELKSRFVSTASHQFRTPLTVIQSNIGLLEMQIEQSDRKLFPHFDKVTGRIKSEIKRMTEIMDEVLMLGKTSVGAIQPVFQMIDIVESCTRMVTKHNEIHSDGRMTSVKIDGENRLVNLDKNLFEDAFSNLLSNSFKYSMGKAAPEVTLTFKRKSVVLEVKDFGLGIPEEDLKNLFTPFFRASNVLDIPGSGLGLSIMKEYIKINKGKIRVESVLNQGTTFYIKFTLRKNDQITVS